MILVTGFGPFGDVVDNPSARLVRSLHGLAAGGHGIEALVLPVRWGAASRLVIDRARAVGPALVLGFGVATTRARVEVEALGRPARAAADVDGVLPEPLPDGAPPRPATLDATRLAGELGATVSDDAGAFLCNAWLYDVPAAVPCPAGFVHVPPTGLAPERLLAALDRYLAGT